MKNILVYGMTENSGGVESVIMNYYNFVNKNKIHFDFICNTGYIAYEDELIACGSKIYKLPSRKKHPFKFYKQLKNILKSNNYDAIWINVCSLGNIALTYLKMAKKSGVKIRIIHSHNSQNIDSVIRLFMHKLGRLAVGKYATDFWSCSQEASDWFYKNKIQKSGKHKIIHNAIDIDKYKFDENTRNKYRKEFNLENNIVIGHVGRFHFQKNHQFVIEVFRKIKDRRSDAKLLLVGKGKDEQKIKNLVDSEGLTNDIIFLGMRKDIPEILQAIDIFLFPSLFEGLSVSLLEAQAAGLDVYSADTVSPKSKVSQRFHFISLKQTCEQWANIIINSYDSDYNRLKNVEEMESSEYNIKEQAKLFENLIQGE